MAKMVRQFRYYNDEELSKNTENTTYATLGSGSIFFSDISYGSIVQLGIQALPGTKFYINNGVNPIIVGSTGIYELDLAGFSEITSLRFDSNSLQIIKNTTNAWLIVDAIYEVEV